MTTVKVRQNSMRDIACSGSVFAYSTPATKGDQSKSMPKRASDPRKKKLSDYGSIDN
jgi:hypothetical protein